MPKENHLRKMEFHVGEVMEFLFIGEVGLEPGRGQAKGRGRARGRGQGSGSERSRAEVRRKKTGKNSPNQGAKSQQ